MGGPGLDPLRPGWRGRTAPTRGTSDCGTHQNFGDKPCRPGRLPRPLPHLLHQRTKWAVKLAQLIASTTILAGRRTTRTATRCGPGAAPEEVVSDVCANNVPDRRDQEGLTYENAMRWYSSTRPPHQSGAGDGSGGAAQGRPKGHECPFGHSAPQGSPQGGSSFGTFRQAKELNGKQRDWKAAPGAARRKGGRGVGLSALGRQEVDPSGRSRGRFWPRKFGRPYWIGKRPRRTGFRGELLWGHSRNGRLDGYGDGSGRVRPSAQASGIQRSHNLDEAVRQIRRRDGTCGAKLNYLSIFGMQPVVVHGSLF